MMEFEEKVQATKPVFSGHLIDVEVQTVVTPKGQEATREVVHHAPAVALLMVDDDDRAILMKQWRAPIKKVTLEVPAGKVDPRDGGDPQKAAIREMNEETRLQAAHLKKINAAYTSVGFCDEYMTTYYATGLTPVTTALPQDADEELAMVKVTKDEAKAMIESGEIEDQKTVSALYYWFAQDVTHG